MAETLREFLAGIGWAHVGLVVWALVMARLVFSAGAARMKTGFWHDYNRGRRW